MSKTTLVCLWWLNNQSFKIIIESVDLRIKIGVLKILIFIIIKLDNTENVVKISYKELSLDSAVIRASLYLLSNLKIITLLEEAELIERDYYLVKYLYNDQMFDIFNDCWAELSNQKIIKFLKGTSNNQNMTYEALINYLMLVKGIKVRTGGIKPIYFDEEILKGNFKGTWKEILIKYKLVEYLTL